MFRICKASNSYLCETRCVHCTVPRAMEVFLNVLLLLKKDPAFQLNHGIHWSRNNMLSQGREETGRAKGVEAEENFKGIKTTHTEQHMSNAVVQQRAAQFWEAISITLLEVTRTPWSIIHIIYNNSYSCINEKKKSRANIKSSQLCKCPWFSPEHLAVSYRVFLVSNTPLQQRETRDRKAQNKLPCWK